MPQTAIPTQLDASPVSVIAVHGNGGGGFRFSLVAHERPDGIRLHAPDLPGFGVRPGQTAPLPSMEAYGAWLAAHVMATPAPRVVLGHGIGGAIVLEMLQRHRELVDGVILHAPVGAALDTRRLPALMRPRVIRWLAQRLIATPLLRAFWTARFFRMPVPASVTDVFFAAYRDCAAFSDMFDLITPPWFAGLRPVDVPAVLLWGGRERVLDPSQASAYQAVLPRATTCIEPEWDHFPMLDAPASYARRIADLAVAFA